MDRRGEFGGFGRRKIALCAILTASALGLGGCDDKNHYAPPPPAKVTVATPVEAPVTLYAEFTGDTAPLAMVDLDARVQGFLTAVNFKDGEAVKKGRVLFEIEKDQYQAKLDLQKALLAQAEATQANAKLQYDRQATLGARDFASQSKVDDAKTALAAADAQVAAAKANVALAETDLGYATVRAPFDGVVTRHLAEVGALVGPSGVSKLATIFQVVPIDVYFTMSEQQQIDLRDSLVKQGKSLKDLRAGDLNMPVQVALQKDAAFIYSGHVDYIAPDVDSRTGTLQMRAVIDNKDLALVPGLFVRVRLPVGRIDKALLVNDAAIMNNQAGGYVMVVDAEGKVAQRQVVAGPVEGQLRVISKGLAAGDKVAIGAIQRAIPGNKVEPVAGAMEPLPEGEKPAPAALLPGSAGAGQPTP